MTWLLPQKPPLEASFTLLACVSIPDSQGIFEKSYKPLNLGFDIQGLNGPKKAENVRGIKFDLGQNEWACFLFYVYNFFLFLCLVFMFHFSGIL